MAISLPGNLLDFRAPPPSPIGNESGRRSYFVNDDVLTEFLEHSLQVPDLILPDRIFPREISIQNPPEIDFNSLLVTTQFDSEILETISRIGCFQLLNHGISQDLIKSVLDRATGVFRMSSENKAILLKSFGKQYGFEEFPDDHDETGMSEEFVWCADEGLKSVMEGIWSDGYSNFSQKLESLSTEIEKVASKVLRALLSENMTHRKLTKETQVINREEEMNGLVCCLYKHCRNNVSAVRLSESSLRSDVIRMLVKGSDNSHGLGVHVCNGASEFHLYSKKGWISFVPNRDAIVVTIGDQIQAWSAGQYKHVIGRPVFIGEAEKNNISMAFLYSPPTTIINQEDLQGTEMKTISVRQQFVLAIFFTIVYHFILNIF